MSLGLGGRQQNPRTIAVGRRLVEGTGQQPRSLLGRAVGQRLGRRHLEHRHRARIVVCGGAQEVGGDALGGGPVSEQQRGGTTVGSPAIEMPHVGGQCRSDHRVRERQRLARNEDPCRGECVRGGLRGDQIEVGELRGVSQLGAVAEHDERPSEGRRLAPEPSEPNHDRAQDARRRDTADPLWRHVDRLGPSAPSSSRR